MFYTLLIYLHRRQFGVLHKYIRVEFGQGIRIDDIVTVPIARNRLRDGHHVASMIQRHPQNIGQLRCGQSALETQNDDDRSPVKIYALATANQTNSPPSTTSGTAIASRRPQRRPP